MQTLLLEFTDDDVSAGANETLLLLPLASLLAAAFPALLGMALLGLEGILVAADSEILVVEEGILAFLLARLEPSLAADSI